MPEAPDWPAEYLTAGQHQIQGWVQHNALMLALALHRIQREAGETGAVAEIGVHHGRLFIALALLRNAEEGAIAVDVFERQDLNPDNSGRGDRAIFEANLVRWGAAARTAILGRDSLTLAAEEIRGLAGPAGVRLFSVDGAHTLRHASNDLRLAEACLAPGGVVLLDDLFHPHWPEVTEAALLHLRDPASRLAPLAICGAKLFLVRREDHAGWLARLEDRVRRYAEGWHPVRFAGQDCRAIRFAHDDGLFEQVGLPTQAQRLGAPAVLDLQGVGPAREMLGQGWGTQQRWGRWTEGPEAVCRIALTDGLVPRRLLLVLGAPELGEGQALTLGVSAGGQALPPIVLRDAATGWHSLDLPSLPAGEMLEVTLRPGKGRVAVIAMAVFE